MTTPKKDTAILDKFDFDVPHYFITGLGHGMKRRKLFPEGRQIISIPFDLLSSLLHNLQVMPWVPPAYEPDGLEFVRRLLDKLGTATSSNSKP
jgi:hypothetical protein